MQWIVNQTSSSTLVKKGYLDHTYGMFNDRHRLLDLPTENNIAIFGAVFQGFGGKPPQIATDHNSV